MSDQPTPTPARRWYRRKRLYVGILAVVATYLALAYLAIPALWLGYAHRHPALEDLPGITYTADGIPGATTIAALRRFQTEAGIPPDGVAGPRTLVLLRQHAVAKP